MHKTRRIIDRARALALLPVIAAITLVGAPVNADAIGTTSAASAPAASPAAQAKIERQAAKAAKKAAKLAAKKAKLCAKKPKKKNAAKLAAKQRSAGCSSGSVVVAGNASSPEPTDIADSETGDDSNGIDPATLPLLFTPTPDLNNGDTSNNENSGNAGNNENNGNNPDGNHLGNLGETDELPVVTPPNAVPEPGTLGLLGLALAGLGITRGRRK